MLNVVAAIYLAGSVHQRTLLIMKRGGRRLHLAHSPAKPPLKGKNTAAATTFRNKSEPVFVRDGKPIPVWELAKLAPSEPDIPKAKERGTAKSGSGSEAAKKAWETIRRKRGIRTGHELA